jgi:hypothetical protein
VLSTPTPDQVRSLAPDAAAARAGEALAKRRRWSATGRDDRAAWGLCQGSGAAPYQVTVDFAGPAFKCSCPSRKFPCKHGLGILFLLASEPASFPPGDPPGWAAEWLKSRTDRAEAAEARVQTRQVRAMDARAPGDSAARDRRIEARERKVQAGLDDLDRWLQDLVRRGLAAAKGEGYRFWDQAGARLVDAQAAALGREVRALGATFNSGAGWADWALERVGRLHLIIEAYRRLEHLPPDLRTDIRALVGWTIKEDELPRDSVVTDRWLVVGRTVTADDRLTTARTWLLGEATGRFALHLAFGAGGANAPAIGLPGASFRSSLVFYPSATPLRVALSGSPDAASSVSEFPEAARRSIGGAAEVFTHILARNPFLTSWPVILDPIVPVGRDGILLLRDASGAVVQVRPAWIGARLMAAAGGRPVSAFGLWTGTRFRVLSAAAEGRIVDLGTDTAEVTDDADQDAGLGAPRSTVGSPWGQLLSSALLGTERSEVPELGLGDVSQTGTAVLARRPVETRLLAMVGVVAASRKAGHVPATDSGPAAEPAPHDPRPTVAPQVAWILRRILEDRLELLIEWLTLCAARDRRPPDDELPRLLTMAARNREVRDALAPVVGPRALWLVDHLPELAGGLRKEPRDASEAWEEAATIADKALVLADVRRRNPPAARDLLESSWDDLTTQDRARCLQVLAIEPALEDVPLLERALRDTRAEVRLTAADLLVTLPGSDLARLAESLARSVLARPGRRRASLNVQVPSWNDDLARLGIARKAPPGTGERSWWLRELIGRVAPSRWTAWLDAEPGTLIEHARRTDEAGAILLGWVTAARRFGDRDWATVLLDVPEIVSGNLLVDATAGDDPLALLEVLDPVERQNQAARLVASLEIERAVACAERVPPPWSPAMDEAVLQVLGRQGQLISKAFVELSRLAARRMSPARSADFEDVIIGEWNRLMTYPGLSEFLDLMAFRAQMASAFAAEAQA